MSSHGHWFSVSYKSIQRGFISRMSRIFQARFHFLIWRSRRNAPSRVSCTSYQASIMTPYLAVKPGKAFFLCCRMRFESASVCPV